MESIRQYILGIVCTALLVAGVGCIPLQSSQLKAIMKLVSGIIMTLAVLTPILGLKFPNLSEIESYLSIDADALIAMGEEMSAQEEIEIITERTQSYILDKVRNLNASVSVDVELSKERPFIPISVTVRGNISPYAKNILSHYMEEDLGIRREDQRWISGISPES